VHRFRVWAPAPRRVELAVDGARVDMARAGSGWWEAEVEAAGPGSRYGFSLDGGDPRPDPRSLSQPEGVLGLSEVIDHSAHRWRDSGWSAPPMRELVIYEAHTGTFSEAGTFEGAIEHLPHLSALGVTAIELMPVAEFSGDRGWGYDGVDLYAPHHAYGGPAGLKRLVDACHGAGLAVILDVVYNHLGPAGNFLAEFGPYFSARRRTAWGEGINFDGDGAAEVRRFFVDNAVAWVRDYHVDGLRLDAIHAIADESPVHILEEIAAEVHSAAAGLGRSTYVIAEADRKDPRLVEDRAAGGYGLDAAWADHWHHALHAALTGETAGFYSDFGSLEALALALHDGWIFDGHWSPEQRRLPTATPPVDVAPEALVVAAQNHDQVGNRATGERLEMLAGRSRARSAAALLLTTQFTPLVFQGEEWAASTPFLYFTDHRDPALGRAVSEGRRREFAAFGWRPDAVPDPQDPATFERSKLRWQEIDEPVHREMLGWYRDLIAVRRRLPPASRAEIGVAVDERSRTVIFTRPGLEVRVNVRDGSCAVRELGTKLV